MASKSETQRARARAGPASRGRRAVRVLAQGTLLAAGIAATRLVIPEIDSRFHLFDPTLVDRLREPITRCHE